MSEIAYEQFLKNKVIIAEDFGFDVAESALNPMLKPHNPDYYMHVELDFKPENPKLAELIFLNTYKAITQK